MKIDPGVRATRCLILLQVSHNRSSNVELAAWQALETIPPLDSSVVNIPYTGPQSFGIPVMSVMLNLVTELRELSTFDRRRVLMCILSLDATLKTPFLEIRLTRKRRFAVIYRRRERAALQRNSLALEFQLARIADSGMSHQHEQDIADMWRRRRTQQSANVFSQTFPCSATLKPLTRVNSGHSHDQRLQQEPKPAWMPIHPTGAVLSTSGTSCARRTLSLSLSRRRGGASLAALLPSVFTPLPTPFPFLRRNTTWFAGVLCANVCARRVPSPPRRLALQHPAIPLLTISPLIPLRRCRRRTFSLSPPTRTSVRPDPPAPRAEIHTANPAERRGRDPARRPRPGRTTQPARAPASADARAGGGRSQAGRVLHRGQGRL